MDYDNLTDDEVLVNRFKCDESLMYFTRFWFRVLRGSKFIVNWHHEEICDSLEAISRYEYELGNFNLPPRHSKTELVGVNFIAWGLSKNSRSNWLYITASDELRSETSTRIRDIITHPLFKRMYGIEIKPDQSAKNLWRTKQGGGLKTATIFGQITGFGAGIMTDDNKDLVDYIETFDGSIVMDDINKIGDTQANNANNQKAVDTIFTTVLSRRNSAKTTIVNMQQRAGVNDASAALLEHFEGGKVLNLVIPVIMNGKPIFPEVMDMAAIEKIRTSVRTAHVFETQYMQNPQPLEGLLFPKSELNYFTIADLANMKDESGNIIKPDAKWLVIDPADSGTDNYSAFLGLFYGPYIYIPTVIYDKRTFEYTQPKTIAMGKNENIDKIILETNKEGTLYKGNLRTAFPAIHVKGVHNSGNKIMRIKNQAHFIKKYMLFRKDYEIGSEYHKFMTDIWALLMDGSNKEHDDAPDNLAIGAKRAQKDFRELYQ